MSPPGATAAPRSFLPAFAADLIALELGSLDTRSQELTCAWVLERLGGASQLTRLIFRLISVVLAVAIGLVTGRRYAALEPGRRRAIASRLAASSLPGVAEYVRAVRALAVTFALDHDFSAAR